MILLVEDIYFLAILVKKTLVSILLIKTLLGKKKEVKRRKKEGNWDEWGENNVSRIWVLHTMW
jgi:hypothetical protein